MRLRPATYDMLPENLYGDACPSPFRRSLSSATRRETSASTSAHAASASPPDRRPCQFLQPARALERRSACENSPGGALDRVSGRRKRRPRGGPCRAAKARSASPARPAETHPRPPGPDARLPPNPASSASRFTLGKSRPPALRYGLCLARPARAPRRAQLSRSSANSSFGPQRLRDVRVHAGGQARFAIACHRARGQRHESACAGRSRVRGRGWPWSLRVRRSPASAHPSGSRSNGSRGGTFDGLTSVGHDRHAMPLCFSSASTSFWLVRLSSATSMRSSGRAST